MPFVSKKHASMRNYTQKQMDQETEMDDQSDPTDPNDFSRPYVSPNRAKDEIHREFVRMWFDCLCLNGDYETYCKEKRNGDTDTCAKLEQKFPHIAALFADWGDIFDGVSYAEWIESRSHLFFLPEPVVKFVDAGSRIGADTVTISLPVGLSKADLNRLLKDFVAENENRLCTAPKYLVNGQLTEAKLLTLSRGSMAYALYNSDDVEPHEQYRDRKGMQDYSYTNVARSFLGNAVMYREYGLGCGDDIWSNPPPIPKSKDEVESAETLVTWSYDNLKPYAEAVGKWIAYYEKCIECVIHGVFPAKT